MIIVLCMFLSAGCSDIGFTDNMLMRPPHTTGDNAEIQNIINKETGGKYTLKYPQNGNYRSAIIMNKSKYNSEYAVVFYSTEKESDIHVSIIYYIDNEWKSVGNFTNSGSSIERVIFDDIDGDGNNEMLIGWNTYNNNQKTLTSYCFDSDKVREMAIDYAYDEIVVSDITSDNISDIVLLSLSSTDTPSTAKLLQYSEQEKRPIGKFSLEIDSEITTFSKIQVGKIDDNKTGIVIDGIKSGGLLESQIIYFDKDSNELKNPLVKTANGIVNNVTLRKDIITSRDMDGDNIIEVPVSTQMPASVDEKAGNICNVTSWKQLKITDLTLQTKLNTVINYTDGYYFIMPDKWNGNVTAKADPKNRNMTFYVWNSKTNSVGDRLLTIYRFTESEWENTDKTNLVRLSNVKDSTSKAIFALQTFKTNSKDSLNIDNVEAVPLVKSITDP